jgi:hypothetical protein
MAQNNERIAEFYRSLVSVIVLEGGLVTLGQELVGEDLNRVVADLEAKADEYEEREA